MKQQLDQLAHRVAALTPRQKLAGGIVVSIVIAGAIAISRFAAATPMQAILDQPLSESDITQMIARLDARAIAHTISADKKLLVPADRKLEALADLGYTDSLPGNTQNGFDEIAKQITPWDSSKKTEQMYNRGKEITLGNIIARFPGVKSAVVLIDPTSEIHIGHSVQPSATVSIWTHDGKNSAQLASAAANVLTGAQANLARDRIRITVDGVPCGLDVDDAPTAGGGFERKQQIARALAAKVIEHLAIPNLLVSISVDLTRPMPASRAHRAASPTTQSLGVFAQFFPTVAAPAPPPTGKRSIAFRESVNSASINVPRSYFVNIFKTANPNAKEPSDAILQPIVSAELDKIRRKTKACLGLADASVVTADCYADATPTTAVTSEPLAATPVGWSARIREISLGALAMVSLLLLSLLVKRSPAPTPALALPSVSMPRAFLPQPIHREVAHHEIAPFALLANASPADLQRAIADEHPHTIALMLIYLPQHVAGQIISELPSPRQVEVIQSIAALRSPDERTVREIERAVHERLSPAAQPQTALAQVLDNAQRPQPRHTNFEQILMHESSDVCAGLGQIPHDTLALALSMSAPHVRDWVFQHISQPQAQMIQAAMQFLGPVRISDVEIAQQQVLDAIHRQAEALV